MWNKIFDKAKLVKKHIVLTEGWDPRMVQAAKWIRDKNIAKVSLVNPISDISGIQSFRARDPLTFSHCLVSQGLADGAVSGSIYSSADVIKSAIKNVGVCEGKLLSSYFIMDAPKRVILFADCAVNINPDSEQLFEIAVDTATNYQKLFQERPRVAMLSFSTKGSAEHSTIDKIRSVVHRPYPYFMDLEGEYQFDVAYDQNIADRKVKEESDVAGRANVFIFPSLESGNIGYKIGERVGGMVATGPILQGLKKPVNDLSRGCTENDIKRVIAITCL